MFHLMTYHLNLKVVCKNLVIPVNIKIKKLHKNSRNNNRLKNTLVFVLVQKNQDEHHVRKKKTQTIVDIDACITIKQQLNLC